jgi:hypothetical protein
MSYRNPSLDIHPYVLKSLADFIQTFFPLFPDRYSKRVQGYVNKLWDDHPDALTIHAVDIGLEYFGVVHFSETVHLYRHEKNSQNKSKFVGSLPSKKVSHLQRIPICGRITGEKTEQGYLKTCGYCPSCRASKDEAKCMQNLFGKKKDIQRKLELLRLPEIRRRGRRVSLGKAVRGYQKGKKYDEYEWFQKWWESPEKEIVRLESELVGLNRLVRVRDKSKLLKLLHWFLSISLPDVFEEIFNVSDDLFPVGKRTWKLGKKLEEKNRVFWMMRNKSRDGSMVEIIRDMLARLIDREILSECPGRVPYMRQVHHRGLFDDKPNFHHLVSTWAKGDDGFPVRVKLDKIRVKIAVERAVRVWLESLIILTDKWPSPQSRRRQEFKKWKAHVRKTLESVESDGFPAECVQVDKVTWRELLTKQKYMRRSVMSMLRYFNYDPSTGMVESAFQKRDKVITMSPMTPEEFIKRLVGVDGRQNSLKVACGGLYDLMVGDDRMRALAGFLRAVRAVHVRERRWTQGRECPPRAR